MLVGKARISVDFWLCSVNYLGGYKVNLFGFGSQGKE